MENECKDYKVNIRIKNNVFLKTLEKHGYTSVAQLSRATGIAVTQLGDIANLKLPVFVRKKPNTKSETPEMVISSVYETLCAFFGCTIWELAPEQHFEQALSCNSGSIEMDFDEVQLFLPQAECPQALLEKKEMNVLINAALEGLTPREKMVIEMRFGLNGHKEHTMDEVIAAEGSGVSRETIRQIELRALRKLKQPRVSKTMRGYV